MTEEPTLLAVDAGTSTVKTVAFRTTGEELASSSRETEILRPTSGQIEQDPTEVWQQVVETIKAVSSELPADTVPVGIAITGQGDGLWAITDEGELVGNAILWSDSRAAPILNEWDESGRLDEIVAHCGSSPYPGMSLPLLAWLAREQPDRFARVDSVLSCKDWLSYKLTGERTLDPTEATVPYLDKETGTYGRDVFDLVGIPDAAEALPRLTAPTEVIGSVTEAAARETTLPAGLPVVSGPFDVPASAVGSGVIRPGDVAVTLGTSLTHQAIIEGPHASDRGIQMNLGIDERWTYAIGSNAGTPSLEWLAETIVGTEDVADLQSYAADAPIGSDGALYHPYLSSSGERGPFVDPTARAQFVGLTPEHDTAHLVRAVYEGLSLAVRDCVEHLPGSTGGVALSGGGTSSELWCQLIADCPVGPS
jgi:sugar (pentulose or hexulose) kinase